MLVRPLAIFWKKKKGNIPNSQLIAINPPHTKSRYINSQILNFVIEVKEKYIWNCMNTGMKKSLSNSDTKDIHQLDIKENIS